MVKRKRDLSGEKAANSTKQARVNGASPHALPSGTTTIQVVVGSYERALHGFTASVPLSPLETQSDQSDQVQFADTFLFNAHASSIRCLAISPPSSDSQADKVILASGSTDERINLYQLSTSPPPLNAKVSLPTLSKATISENPKNKELGALLHHSSSISGLYFPSKSKLLTASEDNTIAISRTRDWTVLSTIKAPIPKPVGRPSGDTAAPGEVPAGINDFAVHPSMKLMVSVGKGERCMRLWNLVTGKKAGVLNFDKDILQRVGEGKYSSGEGRKVEWDGEGEEFVVAFERGVIIYGLDSKPRAVIVPVPRTKIHQIHYVPGMADNVLAISTEDGRILFYRTSQPEPSETSEKLAKDAKASSGIPACTLAAQLGGKASGITGRVKDFNILPLGFSGEDCIVVAASSDGAVRFWKFSMGELSHPRKATGNKKPAIAEDGGADGKTVATTATSAKQVGQLIGTYETGHRITCLASFIMTGKPQEDAELLISKDEPSSSGSESDSE